MYYLISAAITVVAMCISILVTGSWGWGILTLGAIIVITIMIRFVVKITNFKETINLFVALCVVTLVGCLSFVRLWNHDVHCDATPREVQGVVTVNSVRKVNKSYLVQQGSYQRIYPSSTQLQPGQQLSIYGITDPAYSCINNYTHKDVGLIKINKRIQGGDYEYGRWLAMKGIDGQLKGKTLINIDEEEIIEGKKSSLSLLYDMTDTKSNIMNTISTIFTKQRTAGWVGGTTIGDKTMIEKSDYDILIKSGLVHLIVVSGGNLALIIVILSLVLAWVPLYIRYVIISLGLLRYVLIVGSDSSVIRALIMALMTIGGIVIGRKRSFAGMLSIALIGLLWYNPLMINDVGLRLSFAAVVGIYVWYNRTLRVTHHRSSIRYIQSGRKILLVIAASTGAWLGTLPVLVRQFGSANLTSILANSVTNIIASATTIMELIVISTAKLLPLPWIQGGVGVVDRLVGLIYSIAQLTVDYGLLIGVSSGWGMIVIVSTVIRILIILYLHMHKMRVAYLLEMDELEDSENLL